MSYSEAMSALQIWLDEPETRYKLQICADLAIEDIRRSSTLRVPRTSHERLQAFSAWLADHRSKIGPAMQNHFKQQFPSLVQQIKDVDTIKNIVDEQVWPAIQDDLRRYALRGLASDWVRNQLGDAILVGQPEFRNNQWNVPLSLNNLREQLGVVVLDIDGNVLSEQTSSREALLKATHDQRLPAIGAAAGK